MKSATLKLPKTDSMRASLKSLVPESHEGMRRVEVELDLDSHEINIVAEDTRALRAALNSYLRWLDVSEEVWNEIN